jgi:hypothetical protein
LSTWFSLSLGDGVTAVVPAAALEEKARKWFEDAGRPVSVAVFRRLETAASLHCDVTMYFSPAAAHIARACGAHPCAKPARSGLELVAGDARCWPALFPRDPISKTG